MDCTEFPYFSQAVFQFLTIVAGLGTGKVSAYDFPSIPVDAISKTTHHLLFLDFDS